MARVQFCQFFMLALAIFKLAKVAGVTSLYNNYKISRLLYTGVGEVIPRPTSARPPPDGTFCSVWLMVQNIIFMLYRWGFLCFLTKAKRSCSDETRHFIAYYKKDYLYLYYWNENHYSYTKYSAILGSHMDRHT